jgi:hypothetical protein
VRAAAPDCQIFDDVDLRGEAHRAVATAVRDLEILRPEADLELLAVPLVCDLLAAAGEVQQVAAHLQLALLGVHGREVHRRRADERAPRTCSPAAVQLRRRSHLLQHAVAHHRDAVAHRHRLDLVVRDVDVVVPSVCWMRRISARVCTRSFASRFESGSSIRNAAGSRTIARPSATAGAAPGERARLAVEEALEVEDLRASSTRRLISCFGVFSSLSPNARLSYTVMCGYSAYDWKTIAMFRSLDGTRLTTRSSILICPAVISSSRRDSAARSSCRSPRADQDEELPVLDQQVEVVDRDGVVGVGLGDVVEGDARHAGGC